MNTQYLKAALAEMLPERIHASKLDGFFYWLPAHETEQTIQIRDREWLHVCWLIEHTLNNFQRVVYKNLLFEETDSPHHEVANFEMLNSAWEQRAVALCSVKGIEL